MRIFIFLLIVILVSCDAKKIDLQSHSKYVKKDLKINDSIKIIFFDTVQKMKDYVFFDYSKNSKFYNDFDARFKFELESYHFDLLKDYRKNDSLTKLIKSNYSYLLGHWTEINKLEDTICLFNPAFYKSFLLFTDSIYYDYCYMDGPLLNEIVGIDKIDSTNLILRLKGLQNNSTYSIAIKCLDSKIGIYMFDKKFLINQRDFRNIVFLEQWSSELGGINKINFQNVEIDDFEK